MQINLTYDYAFYDKICCTNQNQIAEVLVLVVSLRLYNKNTCSYNEMASKWSYRNQNSSYGIKFHGILIKGKEI